MLGVSPLFCSVHGDPVGGRARVTLHVLARHVGAFPVCYFFFHVYESTCPRAWHRVEVTPSATPEGRGQGVAERPRTPGPPPSWGHRPPHAGDPWDTVPGTPMAPSCGKHPCRPAQGCRGGQPGRGTGGGHRPGQPHGLCPGLWAAGWQIKQQRGLGGPTPAPGAFGPTGFGAGEEQSVGGWGCSPVTPHTPGPPWTHVPHTPQVPPCPPWTPGTPGTPHLPFWVAFGSVSPWRAGPTQPVWGRDPLSRWEPLSHPKNSDIPPSSRRTLEIPLDLKLQGGVWGDPCKFGGE